MDISSIMFGNHGRSFSGDLGITMQTFARVLDTILYTTIMYLKFGHTYGHEQGHEI